MKTVGNVYLCTDDGSEGFQGMVTGLMKDLIDNQGKRYDHCVIIYPMIMMKFASMTTKEYGIPTMVSLNALMVDGTGMCGACRVTVDGQTRFTCVEGRSLMPTKWTSTRRCVVRTCIARIPRTILKRITASAMANRIPRVPVREQDPQVRATNFEEVCYGYNAEEAALEASRCLNCKNPRCVGSCPVHINIPEFIRLIAEGELAMAATTISADSSLPSVCGRVCPQESQCEGSCVLGIKSELGRHRQARTLRRRLGDCQCRVIAEA